MNTPTDVLADLSTIADQLECGDLYQPADELRKIRARFSALVESCKPMRVFHTQFDGDRVGIALSVQQHRDFLEALRSAGQ